MKKLAKIAVLLAALAVPAVALANSGCLCGPECHCADCPCADCPHK